MLDKSIKVWPFCHTFFSLFRSFEWRVKNGHSTGWDK